MINLLAVTSPLKKAFPSESNTMDGVEEASLSAVVDAVSFPWIIILPSANVMVIPPALEIFPVLRLPVFIFFATISRLSIWETAVTLSVNISDGAAPFWTLSPFSSSRKASISLS